MNISGEFTVNASRALGFTTLRDANSFVRFAVDLTLGDEPFEIKANIQATPNDMVGRLKAKPANRLEEADNETRMTYSVKSILACKLGSIGQPALRSKAKEKDMQFAQPLRAEFAPNPHVEAR